MVKHSIPVFDADGHVIEDVEAIYKHYEGKFEKTLRQLNQGDEVEKIELRRGDSFKELASEINTLIDKFSKKE